MEQVAAPKDFNTNKKFKQSQTISFDARNHQSRVSGLEELKLDMFADVDNVFQFSKLPLELGAAIASLSKKQCFAVILLYTITRERKKMPSNTWLKMYGLSDSTIRKAREWLVEQSYLVGCTLKTSKIVKGKRQPAAFHVYHVTDKGLDSFIMIPKFFLTASFFAKVGSAYPLLCALLTGTNRIKQKRAVPNILITKNNYQKLAKLLGNEELGKITWKTFKRYLNILKNNGLLHVIPNRVRKDGEKKGDYMNVIVTVPRSLSNNHKGEVNTRAEQFSSSKVSGRKKMPKTRASGRKKTPSIDSDQEKLEQPNVNEVAQKEDTEEENRVDTTHKPCGSLQEQMGSMMSAFGKGHEKQFLNNETRRFFSDTTLKALKSWADKTWTEQQTLLAVVVIQYTIDVIKSGRKTGKQIDKPDNYLKRMINLYVSWYKWRIHTVEAALADETCYMGKNPYTGQVLKQNDLVLKLMKDYVNGLDTNEDLTLEEKAAKRIVSVKDAETQEAKEYRNNLIKAHNLLTGVQVKEEDVINANYDNGASIKGRYTEAGKKIRDSVFNTDGESRGRDLSKYKRPEAIEIFEANNEDINALKEQLSASDGSAVALHKKEGGMFTSPNTVLGAVVFYELGKLYELKDPVDVTDSVEQDSPAKLEQQETYNFDVLQAMLKQPEVAKT